jgi:hypothetical protein
MGSRRTPLWWKNPGLCFVLIIATFVINLLVAFVTVNNSLQLVHRDHVGHHHLSWWQQQSKQEYDGDDVSTRRASKQGLRQHNNPQNEQQSQLHHTSSSKNDPWHRLLSQENAACSRITSSNTTMTSSSSSSSILRPMGFYDVIRDLVNSNYNNNKNQIEGGTTSSKSSPSSYCQQGPPKMIDAAACHINQYSVILFSAGDDFRRVVTTVMAFQSYPSVSRINLILRNNNKNNVDSGNSSKVNLGLLNDNKYGKRILMWKSRGIVNVIDESMSLWDAIDAVQIGLDDDGTGTGPDSDNNSESAVLWIDVDRTKLWNGTTFKKRLYMWRSQPESLAIQSMIVGSGGGEVGDSLNRQQQHNHNNQCIVDLHGLMMHPSYLCYMHQHTGATKELRAYIDSIFASISSSSSSNGHISWDFTVKTIGIFLFFIADTYFVVDNDNNGNQKLITPYSRHHQHDGDDTDDSHSSQSLLNYFGGCSCSRISLIPIHQLQQQQC